MRERALRRNFLPSAILVEPDFDMLLDLYVASQRGQDVSVSSLCIASQVPASTALRHLEAMEKMKLVRREKDPNDRRRCFVRLTEETAMGLVNWLDGI